MEIERINLIPMPKESSTLAGYMYNKKTKDLYLGFKNRKRGVVVYKYSNVHPTVIKEWLSASSQGEFFHAHIKEKYPTEKVN